MIWFKFYTLWGTGMQELSDAEAGRFIKALCTYAESRETITLTGAERVLFTMALKQLKQDADHSAKISSVRAEAGRAGGLSSKQNEANESNCLQNETNGDNSSNIELRIKNKELNIPEVKESVLKDAPAKKTPAKPKPEKHTYGSFGNVLLTDAEAENLHKKFTDADSRIEYFSTKKKAKGYVYKSDYAAILAWADDDAEKAKANGKAAQKTVNEYPDIYTQLKAEGVL